MTRLLRVSVLALAPVVFAAGCHFHDGTHRRRSYYDRHDHDRYDDRHDRRHDRHHRRH